LCTRNHYPPDSSNPTKALTAAPDARQHVSALYQAHALALVKLTALMTSDQSTAEDVVQDTFLGSTAAGRPCTTQTRPRRWLNWGAPIAGPRRWSRPWP
jgi:DNA-directed RNA polymerase specialized sigma24 family protein